MLAMFGLAAQPAAAASPAVIPTPANGYVSAMVLKLVDAAGMNCPTGIKAWAPLIVPIEMGFPQGKANGTIDPYDIKNLADDSALWDRSLANLQAGTTISLKENWTHDGVHTVPVTNSGLLSGSYLIGALCAKPGPNGRQIFPLDALGNPIGVWYVLTFRWVDSAPAQSLFHFERQVVPSGAVPAPTATPTPTSASDSTTPTTPAATSAPASTQPSSVTADHQSHKSSSGLGWPAWLAIVLVIVLAAVAGGWLLRNQRRPS
ncbi:MAG: hypothetical protein ABI140_21390 [Jatrophihabitantaceae bacterium]